MNKHCWHAVAANEENTQVVCCYCGMKHHWRGDHTKDHGAHLPKGYFPVVLFHRPECTWKQKEEGAQ